MTKKSIYQTIQSKEVLKDANGLLSGPQLVEVVSSGILQGADPENINAASIDIRLGDLFLIERMPPTGGRLVTLEPGTENAPIMSETTGKVIIPPGGRILAQSQEIFNLPPWISAEFRLRSTAARRGLDHAFASWCDAGWNGSVLTLEIVNTNQYHEFELKTGDRIGQMIFFAHADSSSFSYAIKGRYNNSEKVEVGK